MPAGQTAYLSFSENIRYLTGFKFTDGYASCHKHKSYVLADFVYEAARAAVKDGWDVVMLEGRRSVQIGSLLSENHVETLGFEDNTVTCSAFNNLKRDFPSINLIPIGSLIENMREYKDSDETDCIIKAQRIAEKAFDHILGYITPDKTETEIALELEYFMRSSGASAASFDIIAVSGKASALPHGEPRPRKLEYGFLTLDFGALYGGYCSDMTRTLCIGRADDEMKRVYNTVLEAQTAALICEPA